MSAQKPEATDDRRLTAEQQQMVADNLGLCGWAVKKWGRHLPFEDGQGYTKDDAYQDAVFGLMRAAQLYDPASGNKFSTYAARWMQQAIGRGEGRHNGVDFRAHQQRGAPRPPAAASLDAPLASAESGTLLDVVGDSRGESDEQAADDRLRLAEVRSLRDVVCADWIDRLIFDAHTEPGIEVSLDILAVSAGVSRGTVGNRRDALFTRIRNAPIPRTKPMPTDPPSAALLSTEKDLLTNDTTDDLVRAFVEQHGDDLGKRTAAFRKVADAARAEADALLALHELAAAKRRLAIPTTGEESRGVRGLAS